MEKIIFIAVLVAVGGAGAVYVFQQLEEQGVVGGMEEAAKEIEQIRTMQEKMMDEAMEQNGSTAVAEHVIAYSDSGYTPAEITVKKGEKVTWRNESSRAMWPATDVHPTHKSYPGSGIEKCAFPNRTDVFDACKGVDIGQEWSFVFEEVGTWRYHDHRNPLAIGTVIVEE